jgi:putative transposase
MPDYRRNRVPGATYFFTVNLLDGHSDLLMTQIEALREAVRSVRRRSPFVIDAWVVLPEHMHCIWTLPGDDGDFPGRWRAIKIAFSKSLPNTERRSEIMQRKGERGIWQRRYWEHTIRDDRDYAAHMDYVHFNPVKHGLAKRPGDWQFSSFQSCTAAGLYRPSGWEAAQSYWRPANGDEQMSRQAVGNLAECASLFRPTL